MAKKLMRHMSFGQSGIICQVSAHGELGRRIPDMGLVPGTPLQIQGKAPFNDPVTVRLKDFTLCLRNNEADYIHVESEKTAFAAKREAIVAHLPGELRSAALVGK